MSHWNYCTAFKRHKVNIVDDVSYKPTGEIEESLEYGLIECYYDDYGNIKFTTERFMLPSGETKEELIENIEMMLKDAKKDAPVLDLEKLWKELEMKELENKL